MVPAVTAGGLGMRARVLRGLKETPVLIITAVLLALLIRAFVLQVFSIPSESMEPALLVGDRIAVERVSYRFREPQRGDIVVFEGAPGEPPHLVKRLIGLPGDHVRITDGEVSVNGQAVEEPYVTAPDGRTSGPYEVPEGHLFFLGDNRGHSDDSRYGLGFVGRDRVVGRAILRLWPPTRVGLVP